MTVRQIVLSLVASLLAISSAPAPGQSAYPSRTVRIIVPVTTGGPSDLVARVLAIELSTSLGKPVIIENLFGLRDTDLRADSGLQQLGGVHLRQKGAGFCARSGAIPILIASDERVVPISLKHGQVRHLEPA